MDPNAPKDLLDAGWNWLEEEQLTMEEWFDLASEIQPSLTWEQFEKDWPGLQAVIAENRRKDMH